MSSDLSPCPQKGHPRPRISRSPRHRHVPPAPSPRHCRSRTVSSQLSHNAHHPYPPAYLTLWSAPALRELRHWVRWIWGADRPEGHHCLHTFEELLARTAYDPNDTAPEATMPPAQWETLFRDVAQGLRPPYTRATLCHWLQTTGRQAWAIGASQDPPPPHNQGKRKGEGKGNGRSKGARKPAG